MKQVSQTTIHPERDETDFPYVEENVIYLLDWINKKSKEKFFTQAWLAKHPKLSKRMATSTLSMLVNKPRLHWAKVSESRFHEIVSILKREKNFLAAQFRTQIEQATEDHLYYSMALKLGMWNNTVRQMISILPGYYASYRPSLRYPGAVVRGLVRFVHDMDGGAFRTWELHRSHGDPNSRDRVQKFEGYIWRREYKYLWMDQDTSTKVARTNMVHQYYSEDGKVEELHGVTIGTWAGRIYAAKIYLERLADVFDEKCTSKNWIRRHRELSRVNLIRPNDLDRLVPRVALELIDPRKSDSLFTV